MRTKIIILCLLIFNTILGQKSYMFEYNYTFKKDTLSEEFFTEKYYLVNYENNNFFISESDLNLFESKDELDQIYQGYGTIKGFSKNFKPSRLKSLKINKQENITFFKSYFNKIKVKYNDTLTLNWSITGDTLTYNGYKCNVATAFYSGREYKAYFTNTIPYHYGPYVFTGLPGLIVYLSDNNQSHIFELSKITNKIFSFSIDDFIDVSKNKFNQIEYEYKTNPLQLLLPNKNISNEKNKK